MASAQAVFGTAELFDTIMLGLDAQQLFSNMRVDRTWREYITRSKKLQTQMFLRPGLLTTDAANVEINPMLATMVKCIAFKDQTIESAYKVLPYSIWAQPECSLRKTLLVQQPVEKKTYVVTKNYSENFGVTLGMIEEAMREALLEGCEKLKDCRLQDVAVYSTKIYGDGVWRGDTKIETNEEKLFWARRAQWSWGPGYQGILPKGKLPEAEAEAIARDDAEADREWL
ncbi:hypothetical protein LTR17_011751 [Elasticomyces elasticus]|nr:hypothetical protein LTR17_011751 [Elasticomyces elasticus]